MLESSGLLIFRGALNHFYGVLIGSMVLIRDYS